MQIRDIAKPQNLDEISIPGAVKGAIAGFQQGRQQRAIQQNTQAAAQAALKQWTNKVIMLSQAAQGQPVDATDYENHLADFVERVMLRSYKIADMDPGSQQKLEAALGSVVQSRNNAQQLKTAFNNLVQQAMVARLDPAKTAYQSPAAQKTVGPGAKQTTGAKSPQAAQAAPVAMSPAQANQAVQAIFRAARANPQAIAQNLQQVSGGPIEIVRTNNPIVNALLNSLGITVK